MDYISSSRKIQQKILMYIYPVVYIRIPLWGDRKCRLYQRKPEKRWNLRQEIIEALEKIAQKNNTSFNNVVVSMIEQCLEENEDEPDWRLVLFILIIYDYQLQVNNYFLLDYNNIPLILIC